MVWPTPPPRPMTGRVAARASRRREAELERAVALLARRRAAGDHLRQRRPRRYGDGDRRVRRTPRRADHHHVQGEGPGARRPSARRAACSAARGIPVASIHMGRSDCLLVFGASFSDHTGIATYVPTIQVDFDRMMLGKFHPVDVPLWGEIGTHARAPRRPRCPAPSIRRSGRRSRSNGRGGGPRSRPARSSPTGAGACTRPTCSRS